MTQTSYEHYQPPHSDFLVHWTGWDIEKHCRECKSPKACHPEGAKGRDSTTCPEVTQLYLDRLKSILKYGLWMTEPKEEERPIKCANFGSRPKIARTCFTELKLSEVRAHASRYGRLGIGFKRPFVMERGGLPVWYYPNDWNQWAKSIWGEGHGFKCDELYAWFLKEMGPPGGDRYEYLNESEWRIICTNWLIKEKWAIQPSESGLPAGAEKPVYLLPVKGRWLALIIYPSIQVLNASQGNTEIRQLLQDVKSAPRPTDTPPKNTAAWEGSTLPVELELDNCVNF